MRLIDADKLLKKERLYYSYLADEFYVRKSDIEDAPTIEERKKGKWIVTGTFDDFLKCSCCGYKKPWNTDAFNFCSNCGAEMREKADD